MADNPTTHDGLKNGGTDAAKEETETTDWESIARKRLSESERRMYRQTVDDAHAQLSAALEEGDPDRIADTFFELCDRFSEYTDFLAFDLRDMNALEEREAHLQNVAYAVAFAMFKTRYAWREDDDHAEALFENARDELARAEDLLDDLEEEYEE